MDRGKQIAWRIFATRFALIWLAGLVVGSEQGTVAWACAVACFAVSRTYGGDA